MSSLPLSTLPSSNPSTIRDKFLVGYQGWFTCRGDNPRGAEHGFSHWLTRPLLEGGQPSVDCWPDVSEYSQSELYAIPGLSKGSSHEEVRVFSSRNADTVRKHLHWMAKTQIDGLFLIRYLRDCDPETDHHGARALCDEVGGLVRDAAEKEGRVFAYMYDVSGVQPERIQSLIERDWYHVVHEQGMLHSPAYLKERGQPVLAIRSLGFAHSRHSPAFIRSTVSTIRNMTPGGVYLIAGIPAYWRLSSEDADPDPALIDVWLQEFNMISPWTAGRLQNVRDVDRFSEAVMKGDMELLSKRNQDGVSNKVDYMPVISPGFSVHNISNGTHHLNEIQRQGGKFLWQQIYNAKRLGARVMFGAMWDGYDDGTVLLPVVEKTKNLPQSEKGYQFLALDDDGYDLPSDWYMRICGYAGEGLRGERRLFELFPSKELQDFWGNRPKHSVKEDAASSSAPSHDWMSSQKTEDPNEPPPPPYTLEPEPSLQAGTSRPMGTNTGSLPPREEQQNDTAGPHLSYIRTDSTGSAHNLSAPPNDNRASLSAHPTGHSAQSVSSSVDTLATDFAQHHINAMPPTQENSSSSSGSGYQPHRNTSVSSVSSLAATRPPLHPSHPSANTQKSGKYNARPPSSPSPLSPTQQQSASSSSYSLGPPTQNAYPNSTNNILQPYHTGQSPLPTPQQYSTPNTNTAYMTTPVASYADQNQQFNSQQSTNAPGRFSPPTSSSPYRPPTTSPQPQAASGYNPYPPQSIPQPYGSYHPPTSPHPGQNPDPHSHYPSPSAVAQGKQPESQGSSQQWPPPEWKLSPSPALPDNRPQTLSPPPTHHSHSPSHFSPPASPGFRPSSAAPPSAYPHGAPSASNPSGQYQSSYNPHPVGHGASPQPGQWNPPAPPQNSMFPVPGQPNYGQPPNPSPTPSLPYGSSQPPSPGFPQAYGSSSAPAPHAPYGQASTPAPYGSQSYSAPYGASPASPAPSGYYRQDTPQSGPPPPPPRPTNNSYGSQSSRPPNSYTPTPTQSSGGMKMPGFAASAIDKFAGAQQRQQLESTVNNLAKSSSKLFSKFTK